MLIFCLNFPRFKILHRLPDLLPRRLHLQKADLRLYQTRHEGKTRSMLGQKDELQNRYTTPGSPSSI